MEERAMTVQRDRPYEGGAGGPEPSVVGLGLAVDLDESGVKRRMFGRLVYSESNECTGKDEPSIVHWARKRHGRGHWWHDAPATQPAGPDECEPGLVAAATAGATSLWWWSSSSSTSSSSAYPG
ncbi:unnamed protein product [Prorocentrum cordatum]|uniref:Uncharacterized protein n=1 Tax=Prorocentrum cordatum TaxID=2364126 RepID=A0ABN9WG05_9DINO|nr:unnamed protein product [Polarella glacialis]